MWEYVKGSEADFEGAPAWVTEVIMDRSGLRWFAENFDYMCKIYSADYFAASRVSNPTLYKIIAERRKVENLQSRVNDANLQQAFQHDKYNRPCKGVTIDVYDVLSAFNVTNPALQHLIKKALAVGQRGHKDKTEDLNDILASAKRAIELEEQQ